MYVHICTYIISRSPHSLAGQKPVIQVLLKVNVSPQSRCDVRNPNKSQTISF